MTPIVNIKTFTNRGILGLLFLFVVGITPKLIAQKNMALMGNLTYTNGLFDVCGYVDSQGKEYAIIGTDNGVSIVDVTIPANPTEVFFVAGTTSSWRGVEVYNNYAYITSQSLGGLTIIDLSPLPISTSLTVSYFTGTSYPFQIAHEIAVDENGIGYIFGSNYGTGGAILLDIAANPTNPPELGVFDMHYLHDGIVKRDTLWGAAIYQGYFSVINVTNKAAPVEIAIQNTPNSVTHNCWISNDCKTLYTTDMTSGGFITSYDVSDVSNITELDRIRSNPGSGVVPYNTTLVGNFLVNSFYKDGVTIVDATHPENLVEVGYYDTYPTGAGNGLTGCEGIYSWLPSGNILATDLEFGLYILKPTYVQACYLEGITTNLSTGNPVYNVNVQILTTTAVTNTDFTGQYKTGFADSGTYSIQFSKAGYYTETRTGIVLSHGITTTLNVPMTDSASIGINETVADENNFAKNYPNPFQGSTTISYKLSEQSDVTINIYNSLGEKVKELVKKNQPPGAHQITWNADDFLSGIYFYEISAVGESKTLHQVNKLSLIK